MVSVYTLPLDVPEAVRAMIRILFIYRVISCSLYFVSALHPCSHQFQIEGWAGEC